mgnify:CR=1 FL=1
MPKWLKKLFCKHEWSQYALTRFDSVYLCLKCDKWKNEHLFEKMVYLDGGVKFDEFI